MREVIFFGFGFKSGQEVSTAGRELWTVNDWYKWHRQIKPTRLYQIHSKDDCKQTIQYGFKRMVNYWENVGQYSNLEIITGDKGNCPLAYRVFDWERAIDDFGVDFFRSSFSHMFAEAIWEGVDRILFRGIDLAFGDEYRMQVPGMLRNITRAREEGIEVIAQRENKWREGLKRFEGKDLEGRNKGIYGLENNPKLSEILMQRAG